MKILALETSTSEGGLAILEDRQILFSYDFKTNENFGQNLFPLIDSAFKESKLTLKDLAFICVNSGPGSYTGLRVGVTCANTLSWANKIPSIGISTLFNMAFSSQHVGKIGSLLFGNDKEAFFASFEKSGFSIKPIIPDEKLTWEVAIEKCSHCDIIIYYSAKKHPIPSIKNIIEWQPNVNSIGQSGFYLYHQQLEKTFGTIQPNYLRDFEVTTKKI